MAVRRTSPKRSDEFDSHGSVSHDDESRTVFLMGDIDESSAQSVIEKLLLMSEKNPKKPITFVISSYGGGTYEAFCIYDVMKLIPAPVHTVGLGKVMSAAVLLLAAGKKGHRKIGRHSHVMYHAGYSENMGNCFDMKSFAEQLEREEKEYDLCMAHETGLSLKEIQELYIAEGTRGEKTSMPDRYISPDEAVRLGFCDEIIE